MFGGRGGDVAKRDSTVENRIEGWATNVQLAVELAETRKEYAKPEYEAVHEPGRLGENPAGEPDYVAYTHEGLPCHARGDTADSRLRRPGGFGKIGGCVRGPGLGHAERVDRVTLPRERDGDG